MPSGARHGIGVVVGLIVTPLIAVCLMYGSSRALRLARFLLDAPWSERLIILGLMLAVGLMLGLVMGSRLSPVASLIPGVVFAAAGLLWALTPETAVQHTLRILPRSLDHGYSLLGGQAVLLFVGVALVVASVPPARWRAAGRASAPYGQAAPPVPMGPGGPAPQPYGASPAPGGQYAPAPGHYAPPASPPQAAPPAPYAPPAGAGAPGSAPGPAPSGSAPERPEEPRRPGGGQGRQAGEWTQMYGGDDQGGKSGN